MVFRVLMYACESWTINKVEHWRTDAFELWCWRRLLRVPWTSRRSNQSILKEISPEYSLEGLMLKLKFQYFGYPVRRADSFEKTLMLGRTEGRRRRGRQRMRWMAWPTQWTWVWVNSGVGDGQRGLAFCSPLGHKESDVAEQLNWTEYSWAQVSCPKLPRLLGAFCFIVKFSLSIFKAFSLLFKSIPCVCQRWTEVASWLSRSFLKEILGSYSHIHNLKVSKGVGKQFYGITFPSFFLSIFPWYLPCPWDSHFFPVSRKFVL